MENTLEMCETTVNISMDLYRRLEKASEESGLTKSSIIKLALKNYDSGEMEKAIFFTTVKYQEKSDDLEWKKFHLTLSPAEYEIFTDLRNFRKLSLSLIIFIALNKYMEGIIKQDKTLFITDTYLFPAYLCIVDTDSEVKKFEIHWGIPEGVKTRGKAA